MLVGTKLAYLYHANLLVTNVGLIIIKQLCYNTNMKSLVFHENKNTPIQTVSQRSLVFDVHQMVTIKSRQYAMHSSQKIRNHLSASSSYQPKHKPKLQLST